MRIEVRHRAACIARCAVAAGLLALLTAASPNAASLQQQVPKDTPAPSPTPNLATTTLVRGINITAWFRFPASRDPAVLAKYLSNQALADLRNAGFDFVRIAIDPDIMDLGVLIPAIRRIQTVGLTVIVSPQPHDWPTDMVEPSLRRFWQTLAPALRGLNPVQTIPEVLNEPVFTNDPAAWARVQRSVLGDIRRALPTVTVILTGQDWGSLAGLIALTPEPDPNVLYSFHFYDPPELTSLAAYRPNLDRAALARLPFPVEDRASCEAVSATAVDIPTQDLMRYYCALDWTQIRVADQITQAVTWATQHHVRLIAGEFGASIALNQPARVNWLRTVRTTLEAQHIPWALWGYDDIMGFAVPRPPPQRPRLDPATLDALGLPTRM